jgi:hypothetical protein
MKLELLFRSIAIIGVIAIGIFVANAAESVPSNVVFTTQYADGSPNQWTQEDLVKALGLLNRKYHRDCEKASGRKAWHGKLKREIINTNELTKTEVYDDGTSFTYKYKVVTPAQAVKDFNSRLSTNGVPARIAAARARRLKEKQTINTVDKVFVAGESK